MRLPQLKTHGWLYCATSEYGALNVPGGDASKAAGKRKGGRKGGREGGREEGRSEGVRRRGRKGESEGGEDVHVMDITQKVKDAHVGERVGEVGDTKWGGRRLMTAKERRKFAK